MNGNIATATEANIEASQTLHQKIDTSMDVMARIGLLVSSIETSLRGPEPCEALGETPCAAALLPKTTALAGGLVSIENRLQRIIADIEAID